MSIAPVYFNEATPRHDKKFIIFVEGKDDAHFLDVLLQDIGASVSDVGVVPVDGKSNFLAALANLKKSPFLKMKSGVAIIRDADNTPNSALSDINSLLKKQFGIEISHSTLSKKDGIKFGAFILPSDSEEGDLEKVCLNTVMSSELNTKVDSYITSVKGEKFPHFYKRKAQIYLAGTPGELSRGAGMGFKRGHFDANHESLNPLRDFIKEFLDTSK